MQKPTLLLGDDHALVRDGMRALLEPDHKIVAEAADGKVLVEAASELRPDLIVTDIAMPLLNGIEAVRQLKRRGVDAKVIFVTMHTGIDPAVEALRLGASGYVLKVDASEELARAAREALAGRVYVTPSIAGDVMAALMERPNQPGTDEEPWLRLTAREREVLQLVAEGHKMTEIGQLLHISARTVERHKYSLMGKLKLRTNAELTKYAIKRGLIASA